MTNGLGFCDGCKSEKHVRTIGEICVSCRNGMVVSIIRPKVWIHIGVYKERD